MRRRSALAAVFIVRKAHVISAIRLSSFRPQDNELQNEEIRPNSQDKNIIMRKALSIPHFDILVAVAKSRRGAICLVEQKQHFLEGSRYTRKNRTSQINWENMQRYRTRLSEGFPDEMFSQVHKCREPIWDPFGKCFLKFRVMFPEPTKAIGCLHYYVFDGLIMLNIPHNCAKFVGQDPHLNENVVRARTAWTQQ